jgi:hypothetical protein
MISMPVKKKKTAVEKAAVEKAAAKRSEGYVSNEVHAITVATAVDRKDGKRSVAIYVNGTYKWSCAGDEAKISVVSDLVGDVPIRLSPLEVDLCRQNWPETLFETLSYEVASYSDVRKCVMEHPKYEFKFCCPVCDGGTFIKRAKTYYCSDANEIECDVRGGKYKMFIRQENRIEEEEAEIDF